MLTPQFELQQFPDHILVTVMAPYIKSNDVEIYIENNEFKFYVKPYFLRLYFPCDVIEDGRESAEYDISTGRFKIEVPKKIAGEHFPDLDMLTTLLAKKKKHTIKPIEVINDVNGVDSGDNKDILDEDNDDDNNDGDCDGIDIDEEGLCWEVEQELFKPDDNILSGYKYGFANKTNGVFPRLQSDLHEMIDAPDPDNTSPQARRELRLKEEVEKFDQDHYVADLMDDDYVQEFLAFKAQWDVEYERILLAQKTSYPETADFINSKANPSFFTEEEEGFEFTSEEKNTLLQLPNKDYLLNKEEEHAVFLSLVDVIFAYAYNHRTTEGDNTSESAWTICKVSGTLSWMDSFKNIPDVLTSCTRRCLCYPLYRHWLLVEKVSNDVKRIFLLGRRWILRCLLDVRAILQKDESKYILSDLYITDLCIWIQKVKTKKIISLANKLQCSNVEKREVGFNLVHIEEKVLAIAEKGCAAAVESSEDDGSSTSSGSGSGSDLSSEEEESSTESSGSSESSELDSDDDDDNGIANNKDNSCSNGVVTAARSSKPTIEVLQQSGDESTVPDDVEVIRTGLEELMAVQTFVDGTIEEDDAES